MKTWVRILVCIVVAIITVTILVAIFRATTGQSSNAIIGTVGALAVFATWYLTGPKNRI
jgi:hypothetical protein